MKDLKERVLSVLVNAETWHDYKSGIVKTKDCLGPIDHAVNIVGYGTDEKGQNYFKIRNSWTTSWGEQGYIRLANDDPTGDGACSVLTTPTYPVCE